MPLVWWRRWRLPGSGATPLPFFPVQVIARLGLLAFYLGYAATGHIQPGPATTLAIAFIVSATFIPMAGFLLARQDEGRVLGTWAWVLPLDVLVLNAAAATDERAFSIFSLLSIATVHAASAMFRTRYVMALAVVASLTTFTANVAGGMADDGGLWLPALAAGVMLGSGGFAASRGRVAERLHGELVASEAREKEKSRSLRQALAAARASEERFVAFSENAPAAMVLFNRWARPVFASRHARDLFGEQELDLSLHVAALAGFTPEELGRLEGAVRRAIRGSPSSLEFAYGGGGGTKRLAGVFFPIEGGAGAIITDQTRERQLQAQVAQAQKLETVGTLAGGIAHDFNNMLTAILGNLHLVAMEVPQGSQAEACLADAQNAGERGAELVRQLLRYARPGIEHAEEVPLHRLFDETGRLLARSMPGITVAMSAPPADAATTGSFSGLQQVLVNLIVNARDAMPQGGDLTVSYRPKRIDPGERGAEAGDRYHVISVADTGTGMSEATVARMFDPFFTTKEVGKGTGLGLSTALAIVQAHGGWLEVDTAEGKGATFHVFLPPAREGMAAAPDAVLAAAS